MRRRLIRLAFLLLAVAGSTLNGGSPAAADPRCQRTDPATGKCLIWVEVPSEPSNPADPVEDPPEDSGAGAACYWDPAKQGLSKPPAGPVSCRSQYGYWSNAHNCYVRRLDPQPPARDPSWQGHEPGEGAVYECFQPQTDLLIRIWSQDPPAGSDSGPTPREVAEMAIDSMVLRAIEIGIAPKPGPDSVGLVGMPVWMWAQSPDEHTVGPVTASASAGGMTITATARVREITWEMGDGTAVVCETGATPYRPSYGRKSSPDCGHTYEKSSVREDEDAYTVTATSSWVVTWSGAGQTGTIVLDGLSRSTQIRIGEAQVLVS